MFSKYPFKSDSSLHALSWQAHPYPHLYKPHLSHYDSYLFLPHLRSPRWLPTEQLHNGVPEALQAWRDWTCTISPPKPDPLPTLGASTKDTTTIVPESQAQNLPGLQWYPSLLSPCPLGFLFSTHLAYSLIGLFLNPSEVSEMRTRVDHFSLESSKDVMSHKPEVSETRICLESNKGCHEAGAVPPTCWT